jgi:hypothetical protein
VGGRKKEGTKIISYTYRGREGGRKGGREGVHTEVGIAA